MNKVYVYVVVALAIILIITGAVILVFQSNENIIDNSNIQLDSSNKINKEISELIVEFTQEGNNYYYDSKVQETQKIYLFSVKSEQQLDSQFTEESWDVEFIDEINGIKYYSVSPTGMVIDIESIEEQLKDTSISPSETQRLEKILQEYKEILSIYENKTYIIEQYMESEK